MRGCRGGEVTLRFVVFCLDLRAAGIFCTVSSSLSPDTSCKIERGPTLSVECMSLRPECEFKPVPGGSLDAHYPPPPVHEVGWEGAS